MEKIVAASSYDIKKTETLKSHHHHVVSKRTKYIESLQVFQQWLLRIIEQNEGVMNVHGKKLVYDEKSLNFFSY